MHENTRAELRPALEEAQRQFELWRKSKRAGSRIPEALWQAAVELCRAHSILDVSRALRLNYGDLKDRVEKANALGLPAGERCAGFVELDFGASMRSSECVVEMEAPNGAKMKMHFRGVQRDLDPVELSRVFWRQGL